MCIQLESHFTNELDLFHFDTGTSARFLVGEGQGRFLQECMAFLFSEFEQCVCVCVCVCGGLLVVY